MRIEQEREHRCASGSVTFGDSYERFVLWWIEWFGRHDSFRGYESILLQLVGWTDLGRPDWAFGGDLYSDSNRSSQLYRIESSDHHPAIGNICLRDARRRCMSWRIDRIDRHICQRWNESIHIQLERGTND